MPTPRWPHGGAPGQPTARDPAARTPRTGEPHDTHQHGTDRTGGEGGEAHEVKHEFSHGGRVRHGRDGRATTATTGARAPAVPAPGPLPAVDWDDLVTAALLGTERRTPPARPGGQDAAAGLLDAAAVETVRRRAGLRPAPAARTARREPAPDDHGPRCRPRRRRRLALLLADRPAVPAAAAGAAPPPT